MRLRSRARAFSYSPHTHANVTVYRTKSGLVIALREKRVQLCQVASNKWLSISALAEELGRNRGLVTRDVNKLKRFGLVRLRKQVNPGHGVVQIVEPVARKIEMRIAL